MKYIKYMVLWLIGLGGAVGAHLAPSGTCYGDTNAACTSSLEIFFCGSMVLAFFSLIGAIIFDNTEH